jgi:hypothetical protein
VSSLSEVTLLLGERAGDLERARDIFTSDIRNFVTSILSALRRARSEPWIQARVRIDIPRDIDFEAKSTVPLSSQYAIARCDLRFKRGTAFRVVARINAGVLFDESVDAFVWQVDLIPEARYQRIDDGIWHHWRGALGAALPPGSAHQAKSNTVRFVQRPLGKSLTAEAAFDDVKQVLEVTLLADAPLAEAVGLEPVEEE